MKVCILTEGGKNIGFGHITRCASIYQAFEEIGVSPEFIVKGDENVRGLLQDKNSKVFDWLNNQETLLAIVRNVDVAFIDSYLADYSLYEKISKLVKTGVYFDDDIRIEYPKGFVLNGTVLAKQMSYPKKKDVTYLLGPQYIPLRKTFWNIPAKLIHDNIETVMVTFGGSDMCDITPKIQKVLNETYPYLQKRIILTRLFANMSEIKKLRDKNTELIYEPDAIKLKKIMQESDIAISAGGQTLYELARIGVPTIAVCTADNQLNNICSWEKTGFVEYAGWWEDKKITDVILQKVELLKNKTLREKKHTISNKYIDGKGSKRIVEELLYDFYNKQLVLREATSEDTRNIFNLANDDTVRKNSFNPGKIEWEHHLKWLREKLANSNYSFFIVECFGRFAGQVRFERGSRPEKIVISMSLHKRIRGLGLSSFIINKSIKKLLEIHKNVKFVEAHIKVENTPSIKSFEKAGFDFLRNNIVNGHNACVYVREIGNFYHQRQVSWQ